jgi:hypothetical protein
LDHVLTYAFRVVSVATSKLREAIDKRDISILWGSHKSVAEVEQWADVLMNDTAIRLAPGKVSTTFLTRMRNGEYPPGLIAPITEPERCERMEHLLEDVEAIIAHSSKFKEQVVVTTGFARLKEKMKSAIMGIKNRASNAEFRLAPFTLFIEGQPGVGKTEFVQKIYAAGGKRQDLPITPEGMYMVVPGQNYFDGADSGQWFVNCDDIDQSVGSLSQGQLTHVSTVCMLFNSKPTPLEQAAVEDKGKVYANYRMGTYCTNFPLARLEGFTLEPMTFWRRFNFILTMKVKPQYADPVTGRLDEKKLDGSDNYWLITVSKFDSSMYNPEQRFATRPFRPVKVFDNVQDLLASITDMFDAYIERQKLRLIPRDFTRQCNRCLGDHETEKCSAQGVDLNELSGINQLGPLPALAPAQVVRAKRRVRMEVQGKRASILPAFAWASLASFLAIAFQRETYGDDGIEDILDDKMRRHAGYSLYDSKVYTTLKDLAFSCATVGIALKTIESVAGFLFSQVATVEGYDPSEPSREAFAMKPGTNWNRVEVSQLPLCVSPRSPTITMDGLARMLRKNMVKVRCGNRSMQGYFVRANFLVTVRHLFQNLESDTRTGKVDDTPYEIELPGGQKFDSRAVFVDRPAVARTAVCVPNKDAVLLYVQEIPPSFPDISDLFPSGGLTSATSVFDEVRMVREESDSRRLAGKGKLIKSRMNPGTTSLGVCIEADYESADGDCGAPVAARCGAYVAIVGHHVGVIGISVGNAPEVTKAQAESLTQIDVAKSIAELVSVLPTLRDVKLSIDLQSLTRPGDKVVQELEPLPVKSSLWVAMAGAQTPLFSPGKLKRPLLASKMKTKVVSTRFAKDFEEEEISWTGRIGYYEAPIFKGEMREGAWVDPYVTNLKKRTNGRANERLLAVAVADYVRPFANMIGRDQVRVLSDTEVLAGLDGTWVNAVKLNTSAGPPFLTQKNKLICCSPDRKTWWIKKEMWDDIERVGACLKRGEVPVGYVACTQKDEPVSFEKNAKLGARIFGCINFSLNFWLKKVCGPLEVLARANPDVTEMAVGINMTSLADVEWLVSRIQSHAGGLIDDGDYECFDGTQGLDLRGKAELMVWLKLADMAGYTPEEKEWVRLLILATLFTLMIIKNDLLLSTAWNPSGNNLTITINCFDNSILERYCFFYCMAENGWDYINENLDKPTLEFRNYVALVTYGDDDLKNKSKGLATLFSAEDQRRYLKTVGMKYTPGDKTLGGAAKTKIEEATFLKRSFRQENGVWFAPLAKKTLAKMLTVRMLSTLSEVDHHAVILKNVMRESFLHGKDFFDKMQKKVITVAHKYGFDESDQFDPGNYDEFLASYLKGDFKAWETNLADGDFAFIPGGSLEGATKMKCLGEDYKLLGADLNKNEYNKC